MSANYTIKFTRSAREDLDRCLADYGAEVHDKLWKWMNAICESASRKQLDLISMKLIDFLEELLGELDETDMTFSSFNKRTFLQRIRGLLFMLRHHQRPWVVRASTQSIPVFSKIIECSIIFEVDHLKQRVVFRKFIDLPGQ